MNTEQIQYTLLALHYNPGIVDGIYGVNTRLAVLEFQKDAKITADGICGKQTQQEMCKWLLDGKTKPVIPIQQNHTFTPRLTKPENGNPFYNTRASGGHSTCILGKPTDAGCNVLSNCVGYALGRFNEIIGSWKYTIGGNAEDFWNNRGSLKGDQVPEVGAIMCWKKGQAGNSADGAGHVEVVEKINPDGSLLVSASGWNSSPFWTRTRYKGNGNWGATGYDFQGFIHQPNSTK